MMRVGVVAALAGELKPLVRGWEAIKVEGNVLYRTVREDVEVVAVCCGMGREPVSRACILAMRGGEMAALVSIGWAGALLCDMTPGTAYTVHEVVDAATGERHPTAGVHDGPAIRLVTTRRIAGKTEKRELAQNYGAVLVDMEAATVGRLARVHNLPFYCVKAVSDGANESLPDMNPFVTRAGQMDVSRLTASAAIRPQYWPALMRMGKHSRSGAVALAAKVNQLVADLFVNEFKHADDHQRI